ncbi:MAG TPA: hypothetical protein VEL51_08925 [Vicinamibacterales bacterium]|nr:hypothetical protein [Vicinamibacterales bacterium]
MGIVAVSVVIVPSTVVATVVIAGIVVTVVIVLVTAAGPDLSRGCVSRPVKDFVCMAASDSFSG